MEAGAPDRRPHLAGARLRAAASPVLAPVPSPYRASARAWSQTWANTPGRRRSLADRSRRQSFRLDPFEASPQPRLEGDVPVRLKQQRKQEVAAELPVPDPRVPRLQDRERRDVDEDRPRADPLDVVRRSVLEDHAPAQRRLEDLEMQQRRVLEHAEGPFVRIGHERDRLVGEGRDPPWLGGRRGRRFGLVRPRARLPRPLAAARVHPRGAHDLPRRLQRLEPGGRAQRLPIRQPLRGEAPEYLTFAMEDPARPIAERPRIPVPRSVPCSFPFHRPGTRPVLVSRLRMISPAGRRLRAPRCRCDKAHGPKDAEGVADTTSKRLEGGTSLVYQRWQIGVRSRKLVEISGLDSLRHRGLLEAPWPSQLSQVVGAVSWLGGTRLLPAMTRHVRARSGASNMSRWSEAQPR